MVVVAVEAATVDEATAVAAVVVVVVTEVGFDNLGPSFTMNG